MTQHVTSTADTGGESLTTALLNNLLGEAGTLAIQAHGLLAPVAQTRDALRERLLTEGQILTIGAPDPTRRSLAAVDGGSVREHLYAADLMVAVAASATGITSRIDRPLKQAHWAAVRAHVSENDRLLSAAMAALELRLLAELDHDIRILDGSHSTPIIALGTALAARSPEVADAAAELCTDDVIAAAAALADPSNRDNGGEIIALPKADSAHRFADLYHQRYDLHLPGGDRFIAAQILQPGEMLYPRPAREIAAMYIHTQDGAGERVARVSAALGHAITPLREAAQNDEVLITYIKPLTADVPIKIEFRVSDPLPQVANHQSTAVLEAQRLGRIISDETPGPFMQEPFAQHAVDLAAKSIAVGAEALNQAMLANLPNGSDAYIGLLARSYRT